MWGPLVMNLENHTVTKSGEIIELTAKAVSYTHLLVDLFTRQARKSVQEKEKGSVLQKLKQELPAHKPAAPKKREPER